MTGHSHGTGHGAAPTPDELRAQVEETRKELGETVEALAARADVRAQARQKAAHLRSQATDTAHTVRAKARGAVGGTKQAGPGLPLAAGVVVLAAVLLAVRSRRH